VLDTVQMEFPILPADAKLVVPNDFSEGGNIFCPDPKSSRIEKHRSTIHDVSIPEPLGLPFLPRRLHTHHSPDATIGAVAQQPSASIFTNSPQSLDFQSVPASDLPVRSDRSVASLLSSTSSRLSLRQQYEFIFQLLVYMYGFY
jgi:hypothetical protein